MFERLLLWSYAAVATVAGSVVGVGHVAFRTEPGRSVVTRSAVAFLNDKLRGVASVEHLGGSITGGLELTGVQLSDSAGIPLFDFPHLAVRYRVRDLLGGRVVLGQLVLDEPTFNLVKFRDGRFNLTDVLALGGGDGGPGPLVAFRDVEIRGGTVVLSTPIDAPDSTMATEFVGGDLMRVRRFDDLRARIPYLRLTSPIPGQEAIRAEIGELTSLISDPEFDVRRLRGVVEVHGDSLRLDLAEARLPDSRMRVRGAVTWPDGPPLLDLGLEAQRIASADFPKSMVPFPDGLAGAGTYHLVARGPDTLAITGRNISMSGREGGGQLTGDLGFVTGPNGFWAMEETVLSFDRFDLEYFGLILDSLPVHGRFTGDVSMTGRYDSLDVELDGQFNDSLASGSRSAFAGAGVIALGGIDGVAFRNYTLRRANIALPTVRLLIPAVQLHGVLTGTGVLNGPWQDVRYLGSLTHRDRSLPVSTVRGLLAVDITDSVPVFDVDVELDSIDFAGVSRTYPNIPLDGRFGGRLRLRGPLDSIAFEGEIRGESGSARMNAMLSFDTVTTVGDMRLEMDRLRLTGQDSLPGSSFGGTVAGTVTSDSTLLAANLDLRLRSSVLVGFDSDSVRGGLHFVDGVWSLSAVKGFFPGMTVSADGEYSMGEARSHGISVSVRADSIGSGREFIRHFLGSSEVEGRPVASSGPVAADFVVAGSLEALTVSGTAQSTFFSWGNLYLAGIDLEGSWESVDSGARNVTIAVDTLARGGFAFSDLIFESSGTAEFLNWFARARIGIDASVLGGGRLVGGEKELRIPVDSLALLIPSDVWFLDGGAELTLRDRAVVGDSLRMAGARSGGRVVVSGVFNPSGGTDIGGRFEGLLVEDLLALVQFDRSRGSGVMSGTFAMSGSTAAPEYSLALDVRDGRWGGFQYPSLRGTSRYADSLVTLDFGIWRLGQPMATLAGTVPVDLSLGAGGDRLVGGDIDLTASAQNLSVEFASEMFASVRDPRGFVDASIRVGGTWENPDLSGSATLSDGQATFPALRVRHGEVFGAATLSGDTIYVDSVSVKSDGRAVFTGFIQLENLTRPILSLDLRARGFHALNIRNFLDLTGSADLHIAGPVMGATVTGRGSVSSGALYFADLLEKNVIDIDDPLFAGLIDTSLANVIREQGLGAAFSTRLLDSLTVDSVVVDMGNDMWLRSQEANIALAGNLVAGKVGPTYRLDGVLNTPRGTYRLPNIQREFRVTGGQLRYVGTPDLDATMSINARHTLRATTGETVNIFVNLGGTLYLPQVRLSSDVNPPIPDTEIVAYLISGGPSFQADETARRFFSDVTGALTGELSSLITDLGVPIDFLAIRPSEEGKGVFGFAGAELSAGIQLFDSKLLVSASQLACPNREDKFGELGVSVEFRLSSEFRFSASRDPLRGCDVSASTTNPLNYQLGVDMFWEKSY